MKGAPTRINSGIAANALQFQNLGIVSKRHAVAGDALAAGVAHVDRQGDGLSRACLHRGQCNRNAGGSLGGKRFVLAGRRPVTTGILTADRKVVQGSGREADQFQLMPGGQWSQAGGAAIGSGGAESHHTVGIFVGGPTDRCR